MTKVEGTLGTEYVSCYGVRFFVGCVENMQAMQRNLSQVAKVPPSALILAR